MPILQVKEECVGDYLEEGREEDLVEEKVLEKRSLVLDIVTEASSHSCCFTAGYTRCSTPSIHLPLGSLGVFIHFAPYQLQK